MPLEELCHLIEVSSRKRFRMVKAQELQELAERESRILYVYCGSRLVRIVRSSKLKKKLYATQ